MLVDATKRFPLSSTAFIYHGFAPLEKGLWDGRRGSVALFWRKKGGNIFHK